MIAIRWGQTFGLGRDRLPQKANGSKPLLQSDQDKFQGRINELRRSWANGPRLLFGLGQQASVNTRKIVENKPI
ncbi:hypothetical protein L484_005681 [Morus notabilis]|uniref:Uncharacterized protein n=1 Tax=Morus notabilis TaxID=981085 RepID=W9RBB3_9ROSA|nr:hypothetical protein L484_005681 [Morus notabilis]